MLEPRPSERDGRRNGQNACSPDDGFIRIFAFEIMERTEEG